jgi:hypothetical protein
MRFGARTIICSLSLALAGMFAGGTVEAAPSAPASPSGSASEEHVTTHRLATGERVAIRELDQGRVTVEWLSGGTEGGGFQVLQGAGHLYVVPLAAAALVGTTLSLDLLDVRAIDSPVGLEVRVRYRSGRRDLPEGLTATGPGTARITDPQAFGKALEHHWQQAVHGEIRPLAGIASLGPLGTDAPRTGGQLHQLRVEGIDRNGDAAAASAVAMNVSDVEMYLGGQDFFAGQLAFSVPTGTYSVSGVVPTPRPDGTVEFTFVVAPEVSVTHPTTVRLDARKAVPVRATAPEATHTELASMDYIRRDTVGSGFQSSFTTFGDAPLSVVPTSPVTVGDLYFNASWHLAGTDPLAPSTYDLVESSHGSIGSDWDYAPSLAELATVRARYHSPVPGRAQAADRFAFAPGIGAAVGVSTSFTAPLARTEYVTARPDLTWLSTVYADAASGEGWTSGAPRVYEPGEQVVERWLTQPMAPGVTTNSDLPSSCPFCLAGDALSIDLGMLGDVDGHQMSNRGAATEVLEVLHDGQLVGTAGGGRGVFPLPEPGAYQVTYSSRLEAPWWPTATDVSTTWSFSSSATEPLPEDWTCGTKGKVAGGGPAPGGDCLTLPLLVASYDTGADLDTVVPAGAPASTVVTVARPAEVRQVPVDAFSADVSFDDGDTWTTPTVTRLGSGRFRLSYAQPELSETSGFASLRIRATDAEGAAIEQRILRAYPLVVVPPADATDGQQRPDPAAACTEESSSPFVSCQARLSPTASRATSSPTGLSPTDIQEAYGLDPSKGDGMTVAVIAAYDNPNAEADLSVYRDHWGLPPCTTANSCFTKVNQRGQPAPLPAPGWSWAVEIALDLDAVSAACPNCHVMLVEADSASIVDLLEAALEARAMGADVISNSYGSIGELSFESLLEPYYQRFDVPFVVASGDYGYGNGRVLVGGVSYPAASAHAIAVGGTTLRRDGSSSRGWTESAWEDGTSGCSAYVRRPAWQKDDLCRMRTVTDLSAVGDPATGLAVYETSVVGGWARVGGTSLSAPLVAGMYGLAGGGDRSTDGRSGSFAATLYQHPERFFDVTEGRNGTNCSGSYLCTASPGYDAPTGLGTPQGVRTFQH